MNADRSFSTIGVHRRSSAARNSFISSQGDAWRRLTALIVFALAGSCLAEHYPGRYAVILEDPPLASKKTALRLARAEEQPILAAQDRIRRELKARNIVVTGSTQSLLNAIFVRGDAARVAALAGTPGVKGIVSMPRLSLLLDRAVPLMNGPAAWNALGGMDNAGAGVKIAVLDTGIDHTHPAFQDDTLPAPEGFPKCEPPDCAFTNRKIIAARSYVSQLGAGSQPNPAIDSRPDDNSPRDRVGHGTAVAMAAAGVTNTGPQATITGMAPKSWLGNYKVFGSPGVNDYTSGDVLVMALEDALEDGMDIAVLSLGGPALHGALEEGADCGQPPGVPCDPVAFAVENAARAGMTVVVAAGNEGQTGTKDPTLSTIGSPATAPSAISAGAGTNSHIFTQTVRAAAENAPDSLRMIQAMPGDGPALSKPITAPLRDVSRVWFDGLACSPLPSLSLTGTIALVQRGSCTFFMKVLVAQNAGALAVVFYQQDGDDTLIRPGGLRDTRIPAMMIGNTDGRAWKQYLDSRPDAPLTLDPEFVAADDPSPETIAPFSSRGPAAGGGIKPEIVAVGTNLYLAAQRFDPNGSLYSPSGYTVGHGTSFSVPLVAGAAALVKQKHPGYTPAQLKSAVVNSAVGNLGTDVLSSGAGKLDAGAALRSDLTVEPPVLSIGSLASATLTVTNHGTAPASLTVESKTTTGSRVSLDKTALLLSAGQSGTVRATLPGSLAAGIHAGTIAITSGGAVLGVPYLRVVSDGIPSDIVPLSGSAFIGVIGEAMPPGTLAFKLIDRFGAPVAGTLVQFKVVSGGGSLINADTRTDKHGIARATPVMRPSLGEQRITAEAGGLTAEFRGVARLRPLINAGGVVNAASFEAGAGAAPGSYISIFGVSLSDTFASAATLSLPLSLDDVSVSLDVPSAGLSLPGRLHLTAPGQVNVQVPWELRGQTSALVKVSIGKISSEVYTLPLAEYSPGVFEYIDRTAHRKSAAALDENNQVIGSLNPARRDRPIQLFLNGLGPVDHQPETGEPTPLSPLPRTLAMPQVTIGGKSAVVEFSGLSPLSVGLYQANVIVPEDVPSGVQPLLVTVGGVASKQASIPIE